MAGHRRRKPLVSYEFGTRIYAPSAGETRYRVVTTGRRDGRDAVAEIDEEPAAASRLGDLGQAGELIEVDDGGAVLLAVDHEDVRGSLPLQEAGVDGVGPPGGGDQAQHRTAEQADEDGHAQPGPPVRAPVGTEAVDEGSHQPRRSRPPTSSMCTFPRRDAGIGKGAALTVMGRAAPRPGFRGAAGSVPLP